MKYISRVFLMVLILGAVSASGVASEVDLEKSTFKWKATKKLSEGQWGSIYLKSAKAEFKGDKLVKAEFKMDMNSFTVDDLSEARTKKFIDHVKSNDFFDVKKYPTANLTIDKLVTDTEAEGKLTIKDKTNPVKIKFSQDGKDYTGTMTFDRTKYDVIYASGNFFKNLVGDRIINDDVTVTFKVVLK